MKAALRACTRCARVSVSSSWLCVECWDYRAFDPPKQEPLSKHLARVVAVALLLMLAFAILREHARPTPPAGFQPSWPAAEHPGAIVTAAKPPRRGKP